MNRHNFIALLYLTGAGMAISLVYIVIIYLLITMLPFDYNDVDLDKNGIISLTEYEYSASYGSRIIKKNGKDCTEYYALKDGLPLKLNCNQSNDIKGVGGINEFKGVGVN